MTANTDTQPQRAMLISYQQLFQDAWELFKNTWVSYLKLIGLSLAFVFLGALIGLLISLPITFVASGSHFQGLNNPTPFLIATFILLGLWGILYVLSIIALGIISSIVSVFILKEIKVTSIIALVKQTKPYFWPYFLTMLLSGLLIWGGLILLVIPGLLIAFFLAFVAYEVILDEKRGRTALQSSYYLVKANFWDVLGRLLILEIAIIVISSSLGKITQGNSLLGLIQLLFSLFASWYARAYVFLLYKDIRAKTIIPQKISFNWLWIVSIVGWVVIVLLIIGMIMGLTHAPAQPAHVAKVAHRGV